MSIAKVEYEIKEDTVFIIGLDVHEKHRKKGAAKNLLSI